MLFVYWLQCHVLFIHCAYSKKNAKISD
uniref:Uncharacterized protein n=1 Tax=Anguilla anguilla TaxID=7936 RepID=A0A0E9T7F2_ANGAN